MIVSKLFSKFKSLFYPKVPDKPHFIINPKAEKVNKDFYDKRIPYALTLLRFCRERTYLMAKHDISLLSRLFLTCIRQKGFEDLTDLEDQIKSVVFNLNLLIGSLLQLNLLYLNFSEEEKRNIELNGLSIYRCKLLYRVDEYEALGAILAKIVSVHYKTSDLDQNLIKEITDLIDKLCPDNRYFLKHVKVEWEYMATCNTRFTYAESLSLYETTLWLGAHGITMDKVLDDLKRDLAILIEVNNYLKMKDSMKDVN